MTCLKRRAAASPLWGKNIVKKTDDLSCIGTVAAKIGRFRSMHRLGLTRLLSVTQWVRPRLAGFIQPYSGVRVTASRKVQERF